MLHFLVLKRQQQWQWFVFDSNRWTSCAYKKNPTTEILTPYLWLHGLRPEAQILHFFLMLNHPCVLLDVTCILHSFGSVSQRTYFTCFLLFFFPHKELMRDMVTQDPWTFLSFNINMNMDTFQTCVACSISCAVSENKVCNSDKSPRRVL